MATKKKPVVNKRMWLVDPIYRKFTSKAFRSLTSPEFYEFFMNMLRNGEHQFQFSNRKIDIRVDEKWVEAIEAALPAMIEISRDPRIIIFQEEIITNVVLAKKIDSQVVKHLCAHSFLVESWNEETGDVRPSKILNMFKEESWDTYENRFVYTLICMAYDFVNKRYKDMQEAMNDEFGAKLLVDTTGFSAMEEMSVHSEMKIKQKEDMFDSEDKNNIFARIKAVFEELQRLMQSRFAKEMIKYAKVRPPLVPTNAIKKNPYLKKCVKLWDFLLVYIETGFTVEIIEQNPEINQKFEQDIFNNIAFTYIILKGYLEDNRDRAMDRNVKSHRRTLRPKYIREIIEELVQDFNLPDVEVRKILIEQLTKEQLMREEQSERYRLVEEQRKAERQAQRQKEIDRLRQLKEQEQAERRRAKEAEQERIRLEKEQAREQARLEKEQAKLAANEARLGEALVKELDAQLKSVAKRHETAVKRLEKQEAAKNAPPKKAPAKKAAKPAAPKKKAAPKKDEPSTAAPKTTKAKPAAKKKPVKQLSEPVAEPIAVLTPASAAEPAVEAAAELAAAVPVETVPETVPETAAEMTAPAGETIAAETAAETPAEPVAEMPAEPVAEPAEEAPAETKKKAAVPKAASAITKRFSQLLRRKQ